MYPKELNDLIVNYIEKYRKFVNIKTFIYMILTFRRIDPIPKNIGFMLSITFWISVVWIISNFAILIMRLIK